MIRGSPRAAHDELWVPPVAARQGRTFTRRQAVEAGATIGQVRWRLATGLWVPVVGSVLRSAAHQPDEWTDVFAARLTWPDATVVLGTAARLHQLPVRPDGRIHALVPHGRSRRGILVPHRYALDGREVIELAGVPVTDRRRTIVDCLGRLPPGEALDLLAWVSSRRLLAPEELCAWLVGHPRRWGNPARAEAADRLARGAVNPAEDLLHGILRDAGIVGWQADVALHEYIGVWAQADVYFPGARLVVEVDGRRAHGGTDSFQSDRTRQNRLIAAGCRVLRYTWADLTLHPDRVAAEIRATLRDFRTPR